MSFLFLLNNYISIIYILYISKNKISFLRYLKSNGHYIIIYTARKMRTHKGDIKKVSAPIIEISSSSIRKSIKEGKNIRPLLPESVWVYLDEMNFYK